MSHTLNNCDCYSGFPQEMLKRLLIKRCELILTLIVEITENIRLDCWWENVKKHF